MLSSAQYVTPKPAALSPAAQPAMPGAGSAGGPNFAQFLNKQPDLPPPAHADPVPSAPDKAAEPAAAPASASTNATARRTQASTASAKQTTPAQNRKTEAADAAKPTKAADDAKACEPGETTAATTDAGKEPETSGLDEFTQLIGLTAPAVPVAPVAPAQAVTTTVAATAPLVDADADAKSAGPAIEGARAARAGRVTDDARGESSRDKATDNPETHTTSTGERHPAEGPLRATDPAQRAKGVELAADKVAAARSASSDTLQATDATSDATPRAATPTATDAITPSFAAVLAQALPSAGATPDAAPVTANGQVHATLHSSAFAPELAASVSLLAVDGVQQAELQLNPADMGPVSVQIVVDGAQAHVSFHAAQADTRQALEQSLPDLAAALQGQGLTLSGGGVFQQTPRDSKGGDTDASSGEGRTSRAGAGGGRIGGASAAAAPARRSVGLLDTFA